MRGYRPLVPPSLTRKRTWISIYSAQRSSEVRLCQARQPLTRLTNLKKQLLQPVRNNNSSELKRSLSSRLSREQIDPHNGRLRCYTCAKRGVRLFLGHDPVQNLTVMSSLHASFAAGRRVQHVRGISRAADTDSSLVKLKINRAYNTTH